MNLTHIRRSIRTIARRFTVPATPATVQAPTAPAPEPAGLYEADEMPAIAVIEAAADLYRDAAEKARQADRSKRKARKLLDRLPVGTYGAWTVTRKASPRQTVDLEAVRRIFEQHGLGPVPMHACAPSLVVTRAATSEQPTPVERVLTAA